MRKKKTSTKHFFFFLSFLFAISFLIPCSIVCKCALIVELLFSLAVAPSLWRHFLLAVGSWHYVSRKRTHSVHFCVLRSPCLATTRNVRALRPKEMTATTARKKRNPTIFFAILFLIIFFFPSSLLSVMVKRTPSTVRQIKMSEKRCKQKVIINGGKKKSALFAKVDLIIAFVFIAFFFSLLNLLFCFVLHLTRCVFFSLSFAPLTVRYNGIV